MDPLALAFLPGIGPKRFLDLLAQEDWEAHLKARFPQAYPHLEAASAKARRERERAKALGVRILGLWEEGFPEGLKRLPQPPTHLYLRGDLPEEKEAIAIVGTRRASSWALAFARRLARELAEAGLWVVSGLARGIDREAHLGALEGGGRTLGVLGSALDRVYPPENRSLAQRMDLLSEFPFGEGPRPEFFPRRNRLIAGLCRAVLVVEAPLDSGALITARHALELGKEVLAVPGRPTDEGSLGANRLIQDGAYPVLSAEDVLSYLGVASRPRPLPELSPEEAALYAHLQEKGEALPEALAQALGVSPERVLSLLTLLELKGLARALPGGRYGPG
ncbi:DNA processing protein DprA [Thermus composti]|uniref:DNA-processing protein DprA n=1 Tax=Thermus composti TaxID=532059 RepID=A0ABV6Q2H5_9DEIN|nr:DNA-processing protein DprA [Thermus composti]GGN05944.1 DNA processing protein DprA [Thermus composti]